MKSLYESILDNEEEIMNKADDGAIAVYYKSLFWPKSRIVVDNKKKVVTSNSLLVVDYLGRIGQYDRSYKLSKTYKWNEFNKFGYKFKCDLIIDSPAIERGVRLKDIDIEPKKLAVRAFGDHLFGKRDLQQFIDGANLNNTRLRVSGIWDTNLLKTSGLSVFDEVELDINSHSPHQYLLPILKTRACDAKKVLIIARGLRLLNSDSRDYSSNFIDAEDLIKEFVKNNPRTKLGLSFGIDVDYVQIDSDGSLKIQNMSKAQWCKL